MRSDICRTCKYCSWMIGIGFGVRCKHPENQKYRTNRSGKNEALNILINEVPTNCEKYEEKDEISDPQFSRNDTPETRK